MDKRELIEKFCCIYSDVIRSNDPDDTKVLLSMSKKAVIMLADKDFRSAKELVECYEGALKYYNFLTESEADEILQKFLNQDGSRGAKWNPESLFSAVDCMGGKIESEPHYNRWALYVTMNKFYSDNLSAISKWVGEDRNKIVEACYDLAVTQLNDKDRPYWVRWYFGLDEDPCDEDK